MSSRIEDTKAVGIDANMLLYAYDNSEGDKHKSASGLLRSALTGKTALIIPIQVLAEFYSVISRGKLGMTREDAVGIIEDIMAIPDFRIVQGDMSTFLRAADINASTGKHFWDCMLASVLVQNGAEKIITENTKDFSGIETVNPFKN